MNMAVMWLVVWQQSHSEAEGSHWLDSEGGSASGVPAVLKTKQDRLRLVSAENTMDSLPIITAHNITVAVVARV